MSYEARFKELLGIDRQSITEALQETTNVAGRKEKTYLTEKIGKRVKPPMEDISHLIDPYGQTISKRLRKAK